MADIDDNSAGGGAHVSDQEPIDVFAMDLVRARIRETRTTVWEGPITRIRRGCDLRELKLEDKAAL